MFRAIRKGRLEVIIYLKLKGAAMEFRDKVREVHHLMNSAVKEMISMDGHHFTMLSPTIAWALCSISMERELTYMPLQRYFIMAIIEAVDSFYVL